MSFLVSEATALPSEALMAYTALEGFNTAVSPLVSVQVAGPLEESTTEFTVVDRLSPRLLFQIGYPPQPLMSSSEAGSI